MWLQKNAAGIEELFSEDAVYVESWGPEYRGLSRIRHWFLEWNSRGSVLQWDIRQFFHKGTQTVVAWYFKNQMDDGRVEAFDGMSLLTWTEEGKICFLQEFGCNEQRYDPYETGAAPQFRETGAKWF